MDGHKKWGSPVIVTVACPMAFIDGANQLAMCLGLGPGDANTYVAATWQDADGSQYSVASFDASGEWIAAAQTALTRPAWDVGQIIDMTAASEAQALIAYSESVVAATPSAITVLGGPAGVVALLEMGLTPIVVGDVP